MALVVRTTSVTRDSGPDSRLCSGAGACPAETTAIPSIERNRAASFMGLIIHPTARRPLKLAAVGVQGRGGARFSIPPWAAIFRMPGTQPSLGRTRGSAAGERAAASWLGSPFHKYGRVCPLPHGRGSVLSGANGGTELRA